MRRSILAVVAGAAIVVPATLAVSPASAADGPVKPGPTVSAAVQGEADDVSAQISREFTITNATGNRVQLDRVETDGDFQDGRPADSSVIDPEGPPHVFHMTWWFAQHKAATAYYTVLGDDSQPIGSFSVKMEVDGVGNQTASASGSGTGWRVEAVGNTQLKVRKAEQKKFEGSGRQAYKAHLAALEEMARFSDSCREISHREFEWGGLWLSEVQAEC
ncbi:hypothetical protein [Streptomyces sp. NPDC008121]|uniref:hypothetical protein n=1 Tax=Streptomyces sp. NPDC008121 TaxID=3364809 RepID=UPI0036E380A8